MQQNEHGGEASRLLLALVGLPGAGKTALAKELLTALPAHGLQGARSILLMFRWDQLVLVQSHPGAMG